METNDSASTPTESAGQPAEEEGLSATENDTPTMEEETAPDAAMSDEPEMAASHDAEEPESESDLTDSMSDEELFLAALNGDVELDGSEDYSLSTVRRGQIVTGTIAGITNSEVLVDVGAKSEGIIGGREFDALDDDLKASLKVGEDIEVYVLTPESRDGHILLSLRRALEKQDWVDAEAYRDEEKPYEGTIAGFNKGGLIVRFGGLRGFVPASQVSRDRRQRGAGGTPEERWAEMVGEKMTVKVIEVDRGRNRLILSERAAEAEMRAEQRAELMDTLREGQVITGRVTRLADFGAFVDIGGVDGLVHISELAWAPVEHPKDVLKPGQEIEVEVINIDNERQRIGLSYKNTQPDPWTNIGDQFKVDQLVQGEVTKLTKFGAFARLVEHPAIEGLIHISELAERRIGHPKEVVNEGDILTLRIIRLDIAERRMGLSLRRVDSEEYMYEDWGSAVEAANLDDDAAGDEPVEEAAPIAEVEPVEDEAAAEEAPVAEAEPVEDEAPVEVEAEEEADVTAEAETVEEDEAPAEAEASEEAEDAPEAEMEADGDDSPEDSADEAEAEEMVEELESEAGDSD